MMKKDYLVLIGVGILSGVINMMAVFLVEKDIQAFILFLLLGAGISYGFVTGVYFIYILPLTKKYLRLIMWVFMSMTGYFFGVGAALLDNVANDNVSYRPNITAYMFGGFVVAIVITIAFNFIFNKMSVVQNCTLVLLGMLIPFILCLLLKDVNESIVFAGVLYVVWQSVITTMLGLSFLSKKFQRGSE